MTDLPKEKLPSIDDLKATLFEIPKSLQKLLEKPVANTWGPLTNSDDPDVELSSELIAKAVADHLHKQQQQNKISPLEVSMEPSNVVELTLDGQNLSSLGRAPFPLAPLTKLRQLVLSNNRLLYEGGGSGAATKSGAVPASALLLQQQGGAKNNMATSEIQRACLAILPELRELQLDHNLFTVFPMVTHGRLEMLNLSNNDIHHFEAVSLPKLEFLDLSGNRHLNLVSLSKSKWTNLITLDISRCEIDTLQPIGPLTNLRSLDCHANKLSSLNGIEPLIHLEFLDASHNSLRHSRLQKAVTSTGNPLASCATTLQELHLQHNQISGVNFFPPTGMKNLWKLVLSDNPLGGTALANADKETGTSDNNKNDDDLDCGDDIGDAEYNNDDVATEKTTKGASNNNNKKLPASAGVARKTSFTGSVGIISSSSAVANRKLHNKSSASARSSSSTANYGRTASSSQKGQSQPQQQQPLTNTGIASKIANLFPQLESLDLSKTGVVSSRDELVSVCTELSRGCVYLRELELPLPAISVSHHHEKLLENKNDDDDAQQPPLPPSPTKQIEAGSTEEMEMIDLVMDKMKLLARFNGYVIRDENKLNTTFEDQKTAESQAELRQALEELSTLEHLMDNQTMAMLKDFTIETTAKKNDTQREKLLHDLSPNQQQRPGSATNKRPGSASGAKSTIPKPRPVVHTTGISRSIDMKMQREREAAKQEFEDVIGDISQSRVKIEHTLDHVSSSLEHLGVTPERTGSPFKEVEKQAAAARKLTEKHKQEQDQKNKFAEAAEKYAEKAPAVANIPRPPPKSSKATAENAKLMEKFEKEGEKLKLDLASAEHHIRTTLHPSAPHGTSSLSTMNSASVARSTTTSASANETPSGKRVATNKKYTDDSSSDDDDDTGEGLIKKIISASSPSSSPLKNSSSSASSPTTKLFTTKGEPQARVSKWSTERKEPLSVRLARITEEFSAREKPLVQRSTSPQKQKSSPQRRNIPSPPPTAKKERQDETSTNTNQQLGQKPSVAASPFVAISEAAKEKQQQQNTTVSSNSQQQQQQPEAPKPIPKVTTFKATSLNTRRR